MGDDELGKYIQASVAAYEAMSPIERAVHDLEQRRSFARGLSKMSTSREVIDAHLDKQPEYVLLAAYRALTSSLALKEGEIQRLREAGIALVEDARCMHGVYEDGPMWKLHDAKLKALIAALVTPSPGGEGNKRQLDKCDEWDFKRADERKGTE